MSITEFQDYDLHTKDWGFLPNAIMQVSGPRSRARGARTRRRGLQVHTLLDLAALPQAAPPAMQ